MRIGEIRNFVSVTNTLRILGGILLLYRRMDLVPLLYSPSDHTAIGLPAAAAYVVEAVE